MKKESNNVHQLSESVPFRYMTEAENKQMADLTKNSFFKEKYRHALKVSTKIELFQLYVAHPEWTAKDILITLLNGYDASLPPSLLLEMAQFIMTEWEILQTKNNELVYSA